MIVKYFSLIATCLSLVQASEIPETNPVSQVPQSEDVYDVNASFDDGKIYTGCFKSGDTQIVLRADGNPSKFFVLNCALGDE